MTENSASYISIDIGPTSILSLQKRPLFVETLRKAESSISRRIHELRGLVWDTVARPIWDADIAATGLEVQERMW